MKNNVVVRVLLNVLVILLLLLAILMNISIFTKFQVLAVISGSMEPTIPYGALIVISPQVEYENGDIVTFTSTTEPVKNFTHRIVKIEGTMAYTKGDANVAHDPEPTDLSRAEGKVIATVPFLGFLVMAMSHNWVKVACLILLVVWAAIEIEMLRRNRRKKKGPKTDYNDIFAGSDSENKIDDKQAGEVMKSGQEMDKASSDVIEANENGTDREKAAE